MKILTHVIVVSILTCSAIDLPAQNIDYKDYHADILKAEKLLASERYDQALGLYEKLLENFPFVFRRDCLIAAQIALHLEKEELSLAFLNRGVLSGLEIKQINKNDYLKQMKTFPDWRRFELEYPMLRKEYEASINQDLQLSLRKMYSKDQKKALGALFRFGSNGQDRYAEKKFAPHSEAQMKEFIGILSKFGYPGEKLIGNDFWASTILSHHNSISESYAKKDTIYPFIKPQLRKALYRGEVSPFELALIDEWYRSTCAQGSYDGYGILDPPYKSSLYKTDELRAGVYLRSVETRNRLSDLEEKTGMDFYLPGEGWIDGKIEVLEE